MELKIFSYVGSESSVTQTQIFIVDKNRSKKGKIRGKEHLLNNMM